MSTRDGVRQALKLISAAFPSFDPTPETLSVWFGVLSDIDFIDLKGAVLAAISASREFAPSPGVVRKAAEDLAFIRLGKPFNGAQAWDLIRAIATRNRHDPDKMRANAEAAKIGTDFQLCIKSFGYGRIRETVWPAQQGRGLTTPEVEQRRKQFLDHWERWHQTKASTGRPCLTDGAMKVIQGGNHGL